MAKKELSPFEAAFAAARKAGKKEFEFKGKKYHTRTKEEEKERVKGVDRKDMEDFQKSRRKEADRKDMKDWQADRRMRQDLKSTEKFLDREQAKAMWGFKKGGKVFKPCAQCPSPAKCKAAGKCMMKEAKKKK